MDIEVISPSFESLQEGKQKVFRALLPPKPIPSDDDPQASIDYLRQRLPVYISTLERYINYNKGSKAELASMKALQYLMDKAIPDVQVVRYSNAEKSSYEEIVRNAPQEEREG